MSEIKLDNYYNLVHWVLQKMVNIPRNCQDYDDFFQIGCVGLINARNTFNHKKYNEFSTYATRCIYNSIANELRSQNRKCKTTIVQLNSSNSKDNLNGSNRSLCIEEVISSDINIIEQVENDEIIDKFNKLDFKYKDIYLDWLNGMKYKELAKKYHFSKSYIATIIRSTTEMLKEELL